MFAPAVSAALVPPFSGGGPAARPAYAADCRPGWSRSASLLALAAQFPEAAQNPVFHLAHTVSQRVHAFLFGNQLLLQQGGDTAVIRVDQIATGADLQPVVDEVKQGTRHRQVLPGIAAATEPGQAEYQRGHQPLMAGQDAETAGAVFTDE
eukprot:Anaeramoba_flamelloidesa376786_11.p1 GENE.a376786_11~~a376786_11.p1  ORF type:complete len:151 (+),score=7.69 a376786_11:12-464(+)